MRLFQQEVKKRIGCYMKQKGFRIRNNTYYYIKNAIAYCITFEQPPGRMYTWAHVNPLYIPMDEMYLCYGNRLNNIADIMLPTLDKESNSVGIDDWCALFLRSMDDYILPFFHQIDNPKNLLFHVDHLTGNRATKLLCCSPLDADRLGMYTYLHLRDLPNANSAASTFKNRAGESTYLIVPLRKKLQQEADEIKLLILKGDDAVNDFCNQTIENTTKLFQKASRCKVGNQK